MFNVNLETMAITMHQGDTGSFKIGATRESGDEWTSDDRMLFTVKNGQGEIVMQRIYRLDDQYDLGNGKVLVEFHNDDTDEWDPGTYTTELRFDVDPIWDGSPIPTARCVDALAEGVPKMIEGSIVRTTIQSTLTISGILGEI
jgi:hypothetical protein